MVAQSRGFCPVCGQEVAATRAGNARQHGRKIKVTNEDFTGHRTDRTVEYGGHGCRGSGEKIKHFLKASLR